MPEPGERGPKDQMHWPTAQEGAVAQELQGADTRLGAARHRCHRGVGSESGLRGRRDDRLCAAPARFGCTMGGGDA